MIEGMPATTPAPGGDSGGDSLTENTTPGGEGGSDDVTAALAQLRETIGSLDALLASVQDVPDPPGE